MLRLKVFSVQRRTLMYHYTLRSPLASVLSTLAKGDLGVIAALLV